jgi:hypothetical protein
MYIQPGLPRPAVGKRSIFSFSSLPSIAEEAQRKIVLERWM